MAGTDPQSPPQPRHLTTRFARLVFCHTSPSLSVPTMNTRMVMRTKNTMEKLENASCCTIIKCTNLLFRILLFLRLLLYSSGPVVTAYGELSLNKCSTNQSVFKKDYIALLVYITVTQEIKADEK